ncbi:MAG: hypothetical protein COU70_02140 [Parcubacteria group bacterium CG10_big_fil_rev_8_21_14_0_10_35_15]|nr:MAG: hypothetical protein COU70_02140 [Parcubacteria group bacterium CG10_big_fil_rev_8_21_14_0_10_35_15]
MDQYFVIELGVGALGAVIVFGKTWVAEIGKHARQSLIEMLVRLAKIWVGIPPLGSLPFRVIIERLLSEEFIVFLVEPDKPANEDFSFISGTDLVDMLG